MIKIEKIDNFTGHRDCIYALEKDKSDDHFFSAGGDGMIVKWNIEKPDVGELIAKVNRSVYSLRLIEEKNELWIGENNEGIHIIDLATTTEIRSIKLQPALYFDLQIADNKAFVADNNGVLTVIDTNHYAVVKHLKIAESSARSIAVNHLNQEVAVGCSDNMIRVFDLKTFALKHLIEAHQNSVFVVKYSPDSNFLLSGSRDAHLKIWSVQENYTLHESIVAHTFAINDLCFSPDNQFFATASMDKSIKIWDAEKFKLLKVIDRARYGGHSTSVNKLLWTKYPNLLLSGSDDCTVALWKIEVK